ncbi:MAG: hypothetical protein JW856_00595 [Dehalococcoidales bacterium]|nr:hypothetical protein [Dehalococcoidales bacterium]
MHRLLELAKNARRRSIEIDRSLERHVESASKSLWPWAESRLLILAAILAVLDYMSTYAFLVANGGNQLSEGGMLARWALDLGGFSRLFWIDIVAVGGLMLLAVISKFLYSRFGFRGFGRAAFVFILLPYTVLAIAAIFNNILLTFLY